VLLFTLQSGKGVPVLIAPEHVQMVLPDKDGSLIRLAGRDVSVKEAFDTVQAAFLLRMDMERNR